MHPAGRVSVQGFELAPGSARILACLVSGDQLSPKTKQARMRALPGDHPCIRLAASASRVLNWRLSLSTSANPIATSAAAILRMKRYITCPSACAHLAPAATKASPVAFNIISSDINMKTMLRRTSTPISPSAKSIPANNNPYSIGTEAIIRRGGDKETRGRGDKETGRPGEEEIRRQGNKQLIPCPPVPLSPCPLVPLSSSLSISLPQSRPR